MLNILEIIWVHFQPQLNQNPNKKRNRKKSFAVRLGVKQNIQDKNSKEKMKPTKLQTINCYE